MEGKNPPRGVRVAGGGKRALTATAVILRPSNEGRLNNISGLRLREDLRGVSLHTSKVKTVDGNVRKAGKWKRQRIRSRRMRNQRSARTTGTIVKATAREAVLHFTLHARQPGFEEALGVGEEEEVVQGVSFGRRQASRSPERLDLCSALAQPTASSEAG